MDTAAKLFFRDGYRAVGIDTIVAESGVAKMTLYRHFPSKDDLIVAFLEDSNRYMQTWFDREIAPFEGQPAEQLVAYFQSLEAMVKTPACYGCQFLNAAVDFPNYDHPGHQVAMEHKRAMRERFRELAEQAGARDAGQLADHLSLLMDGAFMAARMFGPQNPAVRVSEAVKALVAAQVG